MKKKIISIIMAASLFTGILSGCGAGNAVNAEPESSTSESESVPKGRYAETDLPLPAGDGASIQDIIQTGDGGFEAYTLNANGGEAERYTYENGEWKKEEKTFLEGIQIPYSYSIIYGEDKNRYILYPDAENYQYHLVKLSEDGTKEPMLESALSEKNKSGYFIMPDFAAVLEDGRIILSVGRSSNVYAPTGELLYALPQDFSSSNIKTAGYVRDNELLTVGERGFLLYDIAGQEAGSSVEIPFQQEDYDSYGVAAPDGKGGFYIANPQGIHHRSEGGSIWETISDGSLNSLSLPSLSLRKLFVGSNQDFYVWLTADGTNVWKHYTYDPDMSSVPSDTLTVYGLDLSASDTIRQAASMFQLKNPDVRVELIGGKGTAGSTTVSDTIRALNTELLGGNGADVLILDGLPVNSYIEKGVLENMEEMMKALSGEDTLMNNILVSSGEEDGAVYKFPSRISLPISYGDAKGMESLATMETMRNYQLSSELPLRPKCRFETLLRQVMYLQYHEILDPETGKLKPGKIKELLETVEILGSANGAKAVFDEEEDGGMGFVYNFSEGPEGFSTGEYSSLDIGKSSVALGKIKGINDLLFPVAVAKKKAVALEGCSNLFLPKDLIGINSKTEQKDLAKEFVLFVLSKEVQENDLNDGLPVNVSAWDTWQKSAEVKENYSFSVGSPMDDYELTAEWPSKEEIFHLFELAKKANRPIFMDNVLLEIVIDETKGYFEGNISLEQAAQNVENKANLYFSEK